MVKEFCDICGKELKAGFGRYKVKKEWHSWGESGWYNLAVHNYCWQELCKQVKEKRNEP